MHEGDKWIFFLTVHFISSTEVHVHSYWAVETLGDLHSINRGLDPGLKCKNHTYGSNFDSPDAHFDKLCLFSDA
jgi:hypothetical protein